MRLCSLCRTCITPVTGMVFMPHEGASSLRVEVRLAPSTQKSSKMPTLAVEQGLPMHTHTHNFKEINNEFNQTLKTQKNSQFKKTLGGIPKPWPGWNFESAETPGWDLCWHSAIKCLFKKESSLELWSKALPWAPCYTSSPTQCFPSPSHLPCSIQT